jgi:ABC-type Fe3+ transport system permease subunit
MMRIDRSLLEAARDAGASGWQTLVNVILPLCKPGIAIGSIFVVTIVMGDFVTVRMMSGGLSASVGLMMANAMSLLQYPAANAVILLLLVLFIVAAMRMVDIARSCDVQHGKRGLLAPRAFFCLFVLFSFDADHPHPVVPGALGGSPSDERRLGALVRNLFRSRWSATAGSCGAR